MATGKRYYWIKLKDSFMSSDMIDYLMGQPDGANHIVLYHMLLVRKMRLPALPSLVSMARNWSTSTAGNLF